VISIIIRETWNHFKIFKKIYEQHRLKAYNRATTGNYHTGQCARTSDGTKVNDTKCTRIQQERKIENNITYTTNCNHITAVTLYILGIWFVSSIASNPRKGDDDDDDDNDDVNDDNNNNA
jgi:hypothetical protein